MNSGLVTNRILRSPDYIVVGAGAAGCVLAARIAELGLGSVQILEAGSLSSSVHLKVPAQYPRAFGGSCDWQNQTTPQPGLSGRRIPWPSGKTYGGSTAINAMIYMRCHPDDLSCWKSNDSQNDWSTADVNDAFAEIERRIQIDPLAQSALHPALDQFAKYSTEKLDIEANDYLAQPTLGVGPFVRLQRKGRRQSAFDLWLRPHRNRSSTVEIAIASGAEVQEVVFSNGRAMGVNVAIAESKGNAEFIGANKGVILCGGAVRSPLVLMKSGIGDPDELLALGIPPRHSLQSVGKNLQDHLVFPVVRRLLKYESLRVKPTRDQRMEYVQHRSGPRASNIAELGGFFRLPADPAIASQEINLPDFQWHVTPTHYLEYPTRKEPTQAMSVGVTILRPRSRGMIRMVANNDATKGTRYLPSIDPRYHSDAQDLNDMIAAAQWTRSILSSEPMHSLLGEEILPGEKRQSPEQLAATISRFATTIYHYVGTCAMGSQDSGVVDSRFRVHGVDGLWVCDASAIPNVTSGNPQATVMMMAYRLANWLA